MIRVPFLFAIVIIASARVLLAGVPAPELVTAPVEVSVAVTDDNLANAREQALEQAFVKAVRIAAGGIIPPDNLERDATWIYEKLDGRAVDFVSDYKFLDETFDQQSGQLIMRLQVTLFMDSVRNTLEKAGAQLRKRTLPRVAVIIKEHRAGFFPGSNFLALKSLSEDILVNTFRQRGFTIAGRAEALKAGLENQARSAVEGSAMAAVKFGKALDADMAVFGETDVNATESKDGENIEVVITVSLREMTNGAVVMEKSETGGGVYHDVLHGSVEAIQGVARIIARDTAIAIESIWQEAREKKQSE